MDRNKGNSNVWCMQYIGMKKKREILSKQLESIFNRNNVNEFKDVYDWNLLMNNERNNEMNSLINDIKTVHKLTVNFEKYLNSLKFKYDNKYLHKMDIISQKFENITINMKQNYNDIMLKLNDNENILTKDLQICNERFENFDAQLKVKSHNTNDTNNNDSKSSGGYKIKSIDVDTTVDDVDSRPKELIYIQNEMYKNGMYGGWNKSDHSDFLKLYTQINDDKKLLMKLSEIMPHYSLSELTQHLSWYEKHLRLSKQKKEILYQWKLDKMVSVYIYVCTYMMI